MKIFEPFYKRIVENCRNDFKFSFFNLFLEELVDTFKIKTIFGLMPCNIFMNIINKF